MENKSYNEIDSEEIIIKLKEVLAFIQQNKFKGNSNVQEFTNTPVSGN